MFSRLPKTCPFATVIVDTRYHAHLVAALRNVAYFLPNWAMYVLHSAANESFLIEALGPDHQVNLQRMAERGFSHLDYNRLLASATFWEAIDAERILIFQPDAFIRRSGIAEFMEYDFIGAPWARPIRGSNGESLRIGNGGLSLRHRATSLAITKKCRWFSQHEDIYFAQHLLADRSAHLPDAAIAARFSVETLYHPDPMGVHNAERYLGASMNADLCRAVTMPKPYELTIREATYGSPSQRIDVRQKLHALVQEDRLWIPRTANINRILSDPAIGVPKTLSVGWTKFWRKGRTEVGTTSVEESGNHFVHADLEI